MFTDETSVIRASAGLSKPSTSDSDIQYLMEAMNVPLPPSRSAPSSEAKNTVSNAATRTSSDNDCSSLAHTRETSLQIRIETVIAEIDRWFLGKTQEASFQQYLAKTLAVITLPEPFQRLLYIAGTWIFKEILPAVVVKVVLNEVRGVVVKNIFRPLYTFSEHLMPKFYLDLTLHWIYLVAVALKPMLFLARLLKWLCSD